MKKKFIKFSARRKIEILSFSSFHNVEFYLRFPARIFQSGLSYSTKFNDVFLSLNIFLYYHKTTLISFVT